MDMLDFDGQDLYFDEPMPVQVEALLKEAASGYEYGDAEYPLLRSYLLAPRNLTVLVALYRFYYYQHRYDDALVVANHSIDVAADMLGLVRDWRRLSASDMAVVVSRSMGLLRFYLLALKGAGYLCLRLGELEDGAEFLTKVVELDPHDRLGAAALLELVEERLEPRDQTDQRAAG
jgi:tetratricopeptide (TPR) repeat protein